jgi:hypothetical protein
MSRKHYRAIAATLAAQHARAVANDPTGREAHTVESVVYALADTLATDNPLFDRVQFCRAVFRPTDRKGA